MLALNTWVSELSSDRRSLILKWSLSDKKSLYQVLNNKERLGPKEQRLIERIVLIFFKSVQPNKVWQRWVGEYQGLFEEKQRALEIQKKALKKKLLTHCSDVEVPLGDKEADQVLCKYFKVIYHMKKWSSCSLTELYEMGRKGVREGLSPEKSLALASLVMKKSQSITPYDIQLIAVLSILQDKGGRGRLAQVKTGEGKTMIITLLACVLVMQGRSVDIVSSSQYLSMRDQKKNATFFQNFGVVTSHICEGEEGLDFNAHILYGKATDYEFALMREKVYRTNLFQCGYRTRVFDCVIVDEVDNMLIDTACHSARISFPSKRESKQEFYSLIYAYVRQESTPSIFGLKSHLAVQNIPFTDSELVELMRSAQTAIHQVEGVDYVLQTVDDPKMEKKLSVKIIDHQNTGQIQEGVRWSRGIHEFLEVRHGIELDQETMTPIFLSHAIYYDLYRNIYGFSGTLGSKFEREYVQTTYQVDLFDLPQYRPSLREDFPVERFESVETLRTALIDKARGMQKKGRSVLILCQSINETREISALFHHSDLSHQLYNEVQEEGADVIIQRGGESGVVTVSTNNAGRGTDIVLSEESLRQGGLHVIFTDYPSSKRVEDQGIGRAGRQGQPGSSEVLLVTDQPLNELAVKRLEKEREYARLLTNRALFERAVQTYVNQFWEKVGHWKKTATSGKTIEKVLKAFQPHMKKGHGLPEFVVEDHLLKVEQEIFQRWSEAFLEPSEYLMSEHQSRENGAQDFNEALRQLYHSNKKSWETLFDEKGWLNYLSVLSSLL